MKGDSPSASAAAENEPSAAAIGDSHTKSLETLLVDPFAEAIQGLWSINPLHRLLPINLGEAVRALSAVSMKAAEDPLATIADAAQFGLQFWAGAAQSWAAATARWWGLPETPRRPDAPQRRAAELRSDKRFEAPEWALNPPYEILKQAYLLATEELQRRAAAIEEPDPAMRRKRAFHLRQLTDALSPANFLATNPAACRRAIETGGASLADGCRNLVKDLGNERLSMTDDAAFKPGRNLAMTPGKIVYRDRLIELVQYAPRTPRNFAVPLLFVPPWINKFYILDLQPRNSLVRYLLEEGFAVFMISWKNPDATMEDITFAEYMSEGPLAASEAVRQITGAPRVHPIGYCIGGTLLAMTLAYLAAKDDTRFDAATFIVSLQDFSEVGDTAVFIDEPQIAFMEQRMLERGYLDSRFMADMFNLLRANDLIWSAVVNNYLLGNKPPAFDLLYWNSDGTRMGRAAHSFYLRNTYLENNLVKPGKIALLGQEIDLRRITQDLYAVGAEKDHIVPWRAAWRLSRLVKGRTRFTLASSGHIAGIINPPSLGKGAFWINESADAPVTPEEWRAGAQKHDGSWWVDWVKWLAPRCGNKVSAYALGSAAFPPLDDAPGSYVLER